MAIYACSDLHGNGKLWDMIKDFLKPNDILYFLGDACDRGPYGWRIIKEMLADSRVHYLTGNHEIMLLDRLEHPLRYRPANLHHCNGGEPTWNSALEDDNSEKIKWALKELPFYAEYTNINGLKIFMSHSGSTHIDNREDLIWDRSEYISTKNHSEYDVIVHGHTTIPHLIEDLEEIHSFYFQEPEAMQFKMPTWESGAYWYHGYRCDIDCQTVRTNQTVLLNLDTFDEEIFQC